MKLTRLAKHSVMKSTIMKARVLGITLPALLYCPFLVLAQGTFQFVHVTFDGPPLQPPGSAFLVQEYFEGGIYFRPIPGTDGFIRHWSDGPPTSPNNGTPYLKASLGDSLLFGLTSGSSFEISSVHLAGYSTLRPERIVPFYGYRADGSVVYTEFFVSGIEFETYSFGPEFNNLLRVEIPTSGWSLDNLVVVIPEPGTGALILFGVIGFGLWRMKWRRRP
jgi:hypothetical protein